MLRWGDDPGSSRWAQCGHKALTRGRQEVRDREDDGSRVREKKVWIHCATSFEDAGRERRWHLEAVKGKVTHSPQSLQKEHGPA